jgi:hypothetical protein
MERHTVPRSGRAPLVFIGEKLAEERSFDPDDLDRGFTACVFRTRRGGYVLAVHFHTRWHKTEAEYDWAWVCDDATALVEAFGQYDPLHNVVGYPPAERFKELQMRLEETLVEQWNTLMGRVLARIPETGEAP